ncbi:MAG: V-type ATP synthase subunit E family protein [Candidatus Methanofastidiosia archaeon]
MSLDELLKQIEKEAEKKAKEIIDSGSSEAEHILRGARTKAKNIKKEKKSETKEKLKELEKIELVKIRQEYKIKTLKTEKEIMEVCWSKIKEKIKNIDPAINRSLLNKLLHIARATPIFSLHSIVSTKSVLLSTREERPFYVYSKERDREIVTELSDLEYVGAIECLGGIIAETEDRSWRINLTYDIILEEIYEKSKKKIYETLFEDKKNG